LGISHLHDLVLEGGEEEVDDLVLLNRERVKVDLLHGLDLAGLHETTELGHRLPLLLLALCAATGATTATTSTTTVTAALSATTGCESTSVGHFDDCLVSPGGLSLSVVVAAAGSRKCCCQTQLSSISSRAKRWDFGGGEAWTLTLLTPYADIPSVHSLTQMCTQSTYYSI
jgi:hypothetical protein